MSKIKNGIHIGGANHSVKEHRDVIHSVLAPVIPTSYNADFSKVPVQMQNKLGICFTSDTDIQMADGTMKKINEIEYNDEVIDAYGNIEKVIRKITRLWQGNVYKIKVFGIDEITVTPEHPFLMSDGTFKKAKDLSDKDNVVIPINTQIKDKTDYWYEKDKRFLRLLGLYLAEGSIEYNEDKPYRVCFSFHKKETHLHKFVIDTIKDIFGINGHIQYSNISKGCSVRFSDYRLASIFLDLGSIKCDKKRINKKLLLIEPELQLEIIRGYLEGDGSIKDKNYVIGVSTSKDLINDIQFIALRNMMRASIQKRTKRIDRLSSWSISFTGQDSFLLFPDRVKKVNSDRIDYRGHFIGTNFIRKINKITKVSTSNKEPRKENKNSYTVYNLEVTGSHTYTANRVAVHNCVAEATCSLIERFRNDGIVLSRRFMYIGMKTLVDGNTIEGSSVKSGLHFAYKYGTQPESVCPTDTTTTYEQFINFDITPLLKTATKIPGYISVPTDIISLADGIQKYNGLACRYDCGATWYSDILGNITWLASALFPLRKPSTIISGHAIDLISFDFSSFKRADLRNSWSKNWGISGNGYADLSNYPPTEAWAILPAPPVIIDDTTIPFQKNLSFGMTDSEVNRLQRVLKKLGYMTYTGANTNYYGNETKKAVLAMQYDLGVVKFGIESLWGNYFGNKSRVMLNSIIINK